MIGSRTHEKLEYRLTDAMRQYAKYKSLHQKVKEDTIAKVRDAMTSGLETVEILNDMVKEIDMCESNMKFFKEEFEKTKNEYVQLVTNLKIDWE